MRNAWRPSRGALTGRRLAYSNWPSPWARRDFDSAEVATAQGARARQQLTARVMVCYCARMSDCQDTVSVRVGSVAVGHGHPLALIAGPCVVEDPETMDRTAEALVEACRLAGVGLIFKSSYEKDNRTEASAFRGPGLEAGLELLAGLGRRFGLPLTSDVHRVGDIAAAASVLDLIQIPALLCRQTSLLEAAGRAGRPVNIKKGQFLAPEAMAGAVDKVRQGRAMAGAADKVGPDGAEDRADGAAVLLTERGSCFGHGGLVCDLTSLSVLRGLGCPTVVDAGHAANRRADIPLLARAGVAAGADALFLEVHPDPERARCDGSRMLSLKELGALLPGLARLARAVREEGFAPDGRASSRPTPGS